jgi:protoheme ferro-lyase
MTAASPIGVLLVNVGSPSAPTAPAVRRYLREFLEYGARHVPTTLAPAA